MITREEAIKAINLIFEFCCQQMDCKSCPFCEKLECHDGVAEWLQKEHKNNDKRRMATEEDTY